MISTVIAHLLTICRLINSSTESIDSMSMVKKKERKNSATSLFSTSCYFFLRQMCKPMWISFTKFKSISCFYIYYFFPFFDAVNTLHVKPDLYLISVPVCTLCVCFFFIALFLLPIAHRVENEQQQQYYPIYISIYKKNSILPKPKVCLTDAFSNKANGTPIKLCVCECMPYSLVNKGPTMNESDFM